MEKKINRSNQLQARYLKARMEAAQREHFGAVYAARKVAEPANVRAARKIVDTYEKNLSAARDRFEKETRGRIKVAADKTLELILFSSPEGALAAVERFEKRIFA